MDQSVSANDSLMSKEVIWMSTGGGVLILGTKWFDSKLYRFWMDLSAGRWTIWISRFCVPVIPRAFLSQKHRGFCNGLVVTNSSLRLLFSEVRGWMVRCYNEITTCNFGVSVQRELVRQHGSEQEETELILFSGNVNTHDYSSFVSGRPSSIELGKERNNLKTSSPKSRLKSSRTWLHFQYPKMESTVIHSTYR